MFPNRTMSSGEGSFPSSGELGRNSSMPSLKGRAGLPSVPLHQKSGRYPTHFAQPPPCNPHIFDAARFVCEKVPPIHARPRYLDRDRERHVTRWLIEAQDALDKLEPNKKKAVSNKKRPFLRRFHSNDSNKDFISNNFDDSWNENFILSDNKKSKALLKRFRSTNDSFDAGDMSLDRSESTGSRQRDSSTDGSRLDVRQFLEKYSLPRVVQMEGEPQPLLLYKHLASYTRVEAVRLVGHKGKPVGKPIYIPEGYQGWFAVVGARGSTSARAYTCVADLVKARVGCFLPAAPLPVYLMQKHPEGEGRWSFVRGSARAGTPLGLAGVFEEAPRGAQGAPSSPAPAAAPGSSPPKQRYAQLIDPNMTELYVPLSTKGEFYPVQAEAAPAEGALPTPPAAAGGLQRLPGLLRGSLPLRVRLVAGPAPPPSLQPVLTQGTLLLRAVTTESVVVTCSLPEANRLPNLTLLTLNSDRKLQRTQLGYDSEKRMFFSTRIHRALTYCQMNVDTWIRQVTYATPEPLIDMTPEKHKLTARSIDNSIEKDKTHGGDKRTRNEIAGIKFEKERRFTFQGFKADASRLFGKSDKILKDIPDENEGSIIFLSKNELENMNYDVYSDDENKKSLVVDNEKEKQEFHDERMKVFRESNQHHPKFSKWFKNLKILRSTEHLSTEESNKLKPEKYREFRDPFDPLSDKHSSIERYQDMSKLIEDRFGNIRLAHRGNEKNENWQSYRSLTTSSDIGVGSSSGRIEPKRVLTKSVSVQTGILDSPYTDDRMSELGQKKTLSVEQINYYSENDSSLKKKQIYSGNCAKRLEHEIGKQKLSRFERRQRIRPDLIPEKSDLTSSESFDQIQSCEDLNAFGTGSSSSNTNKQMPVNQQSFITEKLCNEFHVKTKRVLSKSTSNLLHGKDKKEQNLTSLDSQMSGKSSNNISMKKDDKSMSSDLEDISVLIDKDVQIEPVKLKRSISSIQNRKLPVIEDLPYGQVVDAISGRGNHERSDSEQSDNIYAEICNPDVNRRKMIEETVIPAYNQERKLTDSDFGKTRIDVNKSVAQKKNDSQFRHIEVVVIDRNNPGDNNSIDSDFVDSDSDEKVSENVSQKYSSLSGSGGFSAGNSLEKDNNGSSDIFSRADKFHAIRLEITHNSYEAETDLDIKKKPIVPVIKNGSYVKFSQGITLSGDAKNEEITEGIYNTLK